MIRTRDIKTAVIYFIASWHQPAVRWNYYIRQQQFNVHICFEVYYGEVLGNKRILYSSGTLLRVLECIMTIWFGVCLVLWLF